MLTDARISTLLSVKVTIAELLRDVDCWETDKIPFEASRLTWRDHCRLGHPSRSLGGCTCFCRTSPACPATRSVQCQSSNANRGGSVIYGL